MTAGDIEISRTAIEIDPNAPADTVPITLNSNILFTATNFDDIGTTIVKVRDESSDKFVIVVAGRRIT